MCMEFTFELVLLRFVNESRPRRTYRNISISHITFNSRKLFNLHSADNKKIQAQKLFEFSSCSRLTVSISGLLIL